MPEKKIVGVASFPEPGRRRAICRVVFEGDEPGPVVTYDDDAGKWMYLDSGTPADVPPAQPDEIPQDVYEVGALDKYMALRRADERKAQRFMAQQVKAGAVRKATAAGLVTDQEVDEA